MSDIFQRAGNQIEVPQSLSPLTASLFGPFAFVLDFLSIIAASLLTGIGYHLLAYGDIGPIFLLFKTGLMVSLFFTLPFLFREKYALADFIAKTESLPSLFFIWNYAFFTLFAVGFLTKSTELFSRATVVLFYIVGFVAIVLLRARLSHAVKTGCASGRVAARQIMLVGTQARIEGFQQQYKPLEQGLRVRHSIILDRHFDEGEHDNDHVELQETLEQALTLTRKDRLDDVILLLPWSRRSLIEHCVGHFATSSVSIHLGPQAIFERFVDAHLTKLGSINTLNLVRPPLSRLEVALKRGFDILASAFGIVVFSPLLLVFALLIKIDSKGPALFRQTRYGFNLEPFEIIKFRTMNVMENGHEVTQAIKDDPRITPMGRFMRKWNIDELPQLLNVLKGDMSLVGPRPHAVAHDIEFEQQIVHYARRMNVKPGITGLAQVNGYRGPTDSFEKIHKRVEHDLHYIDNWSLPLDIHILFLTLFSKKAYDNAH